MNHAQFAEMSFDEVFDLSCTKCNLIGYGINWKCMAERQCEESARTFVVFCVLGVVAYVRRLNVLLLL